MQHIFCVNYGDDIIGSSFLLRNRHRMRAVFYNVWMRSFLKGVSLFIQWYKNSPIIWIWSLKSFNIRNRSLELKVKLVVNICESAITLWLKVTTIVCCCKVAFSTAAIFFLVILAKQYDGVLSSGRDSDSIIPSIVPWIYWKSLSSVRHRLGSSERCLWR